MSAPIRLGVIGSGFGARVVAPVFASTDGCAVVEVVSARDAAAVRNLCARGDVDLISVHSPPFLHAEHVDRAIDAGHAVLCDKPFGRNAADAERLVMRAGAAGVVGLVNFEFRYEPARQYVKTLIEDGALGEIEHVSWIHISSGSRVPQRPYGWLFDRARGGGWLGAWGSHALDALRWWCGEMSVNVAELSTVITSRPDRDGTLRQCDADDTMRVWLRGANGAAIALDSTFAASASIMPRVVICGRDATAEIVGDRRVTIRRVDGAREEWTAPEPDVVDPHLGPMHSWAQVVRDTVRDGVLDEGVVHKGVPSFADGLAVARLLDTIRNAADRA